MLLTWRYSVYSDAWLNNFVGWICLTFLHNFKSHTPFDLNVLCVLWCIIRRQKKAGCKGGRLYSITLFGCFAVSAMLLLSLCWHIKMYFHFQVKNSKCQCNSLEHIATIKGGSNVTAKVCILCNIGACGSLTMTSDCAKNNIVILKQRSTNF